MAVSKKPESKAKTKTKPASGRKAAAAPPRKSSPAKAAGRKAAKPSSGAALKQTAKKTAKKAEAAPKRAAALPSVGGGKSQPKAPPAKPAALQIGAAAPDFALTADDGRTVKLSDFAGSSLVLYFYPKADTPGCTRESCDFRDEIAVFEQHRAQVVGVSKDGVAALTKFKEKYQLPFPLLSDPDHAVQEAYGAWGTKNMYGKQVEGTIRSTVLVGPDGNIRKIWPKVQVEGHAAAVLAALAA